MLSPDVIGYQAETSLPELAEWVREIAGAHPARPGRTGATARRRSGDRLCRASWSNSGTLIPLNPEKRPNSFYCASPTRATSPASRTARSSARRSEEDAGPTNNWIEPGEMRETLTRRSSTAACAAARCTSSRSAWARSARRSRQLGVEITDSAYVALSMRIMTRMGTRALDALGDDGVLRALPCTRSARRSTPGQADVPWPCNADQVHRPLPGDPRDLVLRLGLRRQRAARQEVLRAAHRLGHGARRGLARRAHADPQAHLARGRGALRRRRVPDAPAARPTSPCCSPTIPGWKVETVGDDIAWMRFGAGRPPLRDQPRGRLLRRRAGHRHRSTNPNAIDDPARQHASSPTSR